MTRRTMHEQQHYNEAKNKIDRWYSRYGIQKVVVFLVKDDLHFTRSPGRRRAYQDWLRLIEQEDTETWLLDKLNMEGELQ